MSNLDFRENSFGQFIKDGRAYRVTTPFPPRELSNVLCSDDMYYARISHYGTGEASLKFSDGEVNTVVDGDRKTLYCRDQESGTVWCPGVYPMMSEVEDFTAEHHDAYSVTASTLVLRSEESLLRRVERDGIRVTWRTFLPLKGAREIWTVTVENRRAKPAVIALVPAIQMALNGFKAPRFYHEQHQYSTCDFDPALNGMFYDARNPNPRWKRYKAALAASREVNGFCGDADVFLGAPLAFQYPQALIRGDLGRVSACTGTPFVALQCDLKVAPGATVRADFLFAIVEAPEEARALAREVRTPAQVDELLDQTRRTLDERRSRLVIRTPSPKVDAFVNLWMKKGMEFCLQRKDATRDNLQFADGLVMSRPDLVRHWVLRAMSFQYPDGHAVRSWVPLDETHYGDSHMWLVLTGCGYVKYWDDLAFLEERVPFFRGEPATVLQHLERAIECFDRDRGPRGLPRNRWAEWNDAFNLADPDAENVFLAMSFGYALKDMEGLMRRLGRAADEKRYAAMHRDLKALVNRVAWDEKGGYYVAAFADGGVIGGSESQGARIYINPQTWGILGQMVPPERLPSVLRAIDGILETDLGSAVNMPAYDHFDPRLGRISVQWPGTGENGSCYCHVTGFKAVADTLIGRGDQALSSVLKIMPDSEQNPAEHSGATPFALTSCYNLNPAIYGKSGRPWLTGTQCWVTRAVVEGLLGVRRDYGGLTLAPAFPAAWQSAEVRLHRNEDRYHVVIRRNAKASEPLAVRLNGTRLERPFVPFQKSGEHEIEVILGA